MHGVAYKIVLGDRFFVDVRSCYGSKGGSSFLKRGGGPMTERGAQIGGFAKGSRKSRGVGMPHGNFFCLSAIVQNC